MKIPIAILHATRASLDPVNRYYTENAPELDIFNLLDDGLMRYLDQVDMQRATERFTAMLTTARDEYGAKLAMLTCSAVPSSTMKVLREWDAHFPVFKIDEPMAKLAITHGARIGVLASFPATVATTEALVLEASPSATVRSICVRPALEALFAGDQALHDRLILEAAAELAKQGQIDAVVLAQVSMAHMVSRVKAATGLPVYGSLDTSLAEVKRIVAATEDNG